MKCNDKIYNGKKQKFIKSTKTNRPTSHSAATSLSPIGDCFNLIETSSINHGKLVFVSFERTDILQINNITFFHNRFSILTDDSLNLTDRFRVQLILKNNTWSTR